MQKKIIKTPYFVSQQLFWSKFQRFLLGVKKDPDFEVKFATKIANSSNRDFYAKRILDTIDHIDSEEKVDYIINATRALCWDRISNDEYFRICAIIRRCYYEDLIFVKNNYSEDKLFAKDIIVTELEACGLMTLTIVGGGSIADTEPPKTHQFNQLAELLYKNSLAYEKD